MRPAFTGCVGFAFSAPAVRSITVNPRITAGRPPPRLVDYRWQCRGRGGSGWCSLQFFQGRLSAHVSQSFQHRTSAARRGPVIQPAALWLCVRSGVGTSQENPARLAFPSGRPVWLFLPGFASCAAWMRLSPPVESVDSGEAKYPPNRWGI
jgi:hypothetical protein